MANFSVYTINKMHDSIISSNNNMYLTLYAMYCIYNSMNIQENRATRKERDFTQEQLAESVQVSTETISRLERGVSVPSLKTLEKISRALNTPLKNFFDTEQLSKPADGFSGELSKLINFLKTREKEDIELSYRILRDIFKDIEKNYRHKDR